VETAISKGQSARIESRQLRVIIDGNDDRDGQGHEVLLDSYAHHHIQAVKCRDQHQQPTLLQLCHAKCQQDLLQSLVQTAHDIIHPKKSPYLQFFEELVQSALALLLAYIGPSLTGLKDTATTGKQGLTMKVK
jgi:hypothetical protein